MSAPDARTAAVPAILPLFPLRSVLFPGGKLMLKVFEARYLDLVALIDAWPPAILQMLKQPTPASSLTWTVEFPAVDDLQLAAESNPWWQYRAITESAQNGYAHISAHIWGQGGRLVAISRQTATVFA